MYSYFKNKEGIIMKFLTKSLYMHGQQCPSLLWYSSRNQLPELSLYDQHKFAQGRDFEKHVKKLFSDGKNIRGQVSTFDT